MKNSCTKTSLRTNDSEDDKMVHIGSVTRMYYRHHYQSISEALSMTPTLKCDFNNSVEKITFNLLAPQENTAIFDNNKCVCIHLQILQVLLNVKAPE